MKLQSMLMPLTEFDHVEKGDALYGKFSSISPSCIELNLLLFTNGCLCQLGNGLLVGN